MEIKYEPLGTKKKISGFACEMYKVQVGSFSSSESCIAPWGSNLVTKAEVEQFKKAFADMEKSFGSLGAMRAGDLSKAPGIPVEQVHYGADGKTPEWTTTLKSVSRGSVAASTFQVPAGFTKQEMPMGGRGGGFGPGGGPHGPHGGGPGGPP